MQNEGGVALAGDDKYDIGSYNVDHITDEDVERILQITHQADAFDELMMYYDCAMTEVRTKL